MQSEAASVLASLPDKCSLYLEQATPLPLRSHDGVLQQDGSLLLGNGSRMTLATAKGDGDWCRARPAGDGPVAGSRPSTFHLFSRDSAGGQGHPQYLAPGPLSRPSFFTRLHTLAVRSNRGRLSRGFCGQGRHRDPQHAWVEAYMKLERKLHRAYLDH